MYYFDKRIQPHTLRENLNSFIFWFEPLSFQIEKKMKYSFINEYEFRRGTSVAETARRIHYVYGSGVAK